MKVYDVTVVTILLAILYVLLTRKNEQYTNSDMQSFGQNSFIARGARDAIGQFCDTMISELLNDGTAFTKLNAFISSTNTQYPTLNAPLFTSVAEYNQVFTTAFNSGESAFSSDAIGKRNKMTLRTYASPCISILGSIPPNILTIEYDANGKPTFTDEIVQASGKTVNDVLTFGFRSIKDFFTQNPSGGSTPASTLAMVNDILPSNLGRYASSTEFENDFNNVNNPSARMVFITKAYSVGAAYIAWLAENKWRLDPAWSAGISPPTA